MKMCMLGEGVHKNAAVKIKYQMHIGGIACQYANISLNATQNGVY